MAEGAEEIMQRLEEEQPPLPSDIETVAMETPPLPPSSPPPPLPPSPPPSTQMSNLSSQGLDFGPGSGGLIQLEVAARKSKRISGASEEEQEPPRKAPRLMLQQQQQPDCRDSDSVEEGEILEEKKPPRKCPFNSVNHSASKVCDELDSAADSVESESLQPSTSGTTIEHSRTEALQIGGASSEFQIIDDVGDDDDDDNFNGVDDDDEDGHSDEEDSEGDFVVDEEEIDALLDQGIQSEYKNFRAPTKKEKIILKELGRDPFDILPEDWVTITHNSGMPVYLHRHTRVCTLSRPYFLGPGSARKHEIPLSAIPCLQYRRARENYKLSQETEAGEESASQNGNHGTSQTSEPTPDNIPNGDTTHTAQNQPDTNDSNQSDVTSAGPSTGQNATSDLSTNQKLEDSATQSPAQSNDATPDVQSNDAIKTAEDQSDANASPANSNAMKPCDKRPTNQVSDGAIQTETTDQSDPGNESPVVPSVNQLKLRSLLGKTLASKMAATPPESNEMLSAKPVRIETAEESQKKNSLDPLELREYCNGLFEFKTITVKRYKTWKDRRRHNNILKKTARPTLPSNTKLITCPIYPDKDETEKPSRKKEFVLNPHGKSDICILHEYVQHALRQQPRYIYNEIDNAGQPYSATVAIGNVEYGTGYGNSKKSAKSEAARRTLTILIPDFEAIRAEEDHKETESQDLSFFDQVNIEDPRVSDLSARAGQPKPFSILSECLKRNYGMGNTQIVMHMKTLKHQKGEFTMTVGKHQAKVICKNKRDGKQQAAQAVLQMMHPNIHSWGSLLRLYGTASTEKRKKEAEEQSVTTLQVKSKTQKPVDSILAKLRLEMRKLQDVRDALKSTVTGKLQLADTAVSFSNNPTGIDL